MNEYTWISEDIFTVGSLLSPAECQAMIELAESRGFEDAPINTAFGPLRRPEVRNNRRVILDDVDRAKDLWQRVREYAPTRRGDWVAIGANERLRFYRYDPGQQFEWHHDGCFERPNGERSLLTYMIYLNNGFEGGETRFSEIQSTAMPGGAVVPQTGLALVFAHQLRHKGDTVISGRKYVLRTDIMFRYQPES